MLRRYRMQNTVKRNETNSVGTKTMTSSLCHDAISKTVSHYASHFDTRLKASVCVPYLNCLQLLELVKQTQTGARSWKVKKRKLRISMRKGKYRRKPTRSRMTNEDLPVRLSLYFAWSQQQERLDTRKVTRGAKDQEICHVCQLSSIQFYRNWTMVLITADDNR